MRTKWKPGDLIVNNQQQQALVLSVEQLLEDPNDTEAFLISQNGVFFRVYPYQPITWKRKRATDLVYDYTTRSQVLRDFDSGVFNLYFE